jgi:hypothetical protein
MEREGLPKVYELNRNHKIIAQRDRHVEVLDIRDRSLHRYPVNTKYKTQKYKVGNTMIERPNVPYYTVKFN